MDNLLLLNNDTTLINESLSLKATMKYNNVLEKEKEDIKLKIASLMNLAFKTKSEHNLSTGQVLI